MARAGRDLERLVAVLEELLRPAGLLVRSPDHLRDTVTGGLREVDVSIRVSDESPVVAICECRDRAGTEDVTWIEQVVTKARDLEGSPPAVLVSSAGFSEAARVKARSYGHDVRLVTDVSLAEVRSWFQVEHIVLDVLERGLRGCDVELTPDDADGFSAAVSRALTEEGQAAPIFERKALPAVSALQIFEEWWKEKHEIVEHAVPADGRPLRRPVPITFAEPEECFSVETVYGPRAVAALLLHVEITRTKRLVPASRVTRYSEDEGDLAESVEFEFGDGMGTVSLHKLSEGPIHVRYRPGDGGGGSGSPGPGDMGSRSP
jgi:hypothetical protein